MYMYLKKKISRVCSLSNLIELWQLHVKAEYATQSGGNLPFTTYIFMASSF